MNVFNYHCIQYTSKIQIEHYISKYLIQKTLKKRNGLRTNKAILFNMDYKLSGIAFARPFRHLIKY
jgi:hypothetical protein